MTYSVNMPPLPVGKLVEWYGGDHYKRAPSISGEWLKPTLHPTLHQFYRYNITSKVANASLAMAAGAAATALHTSNPLGAVLALVPLWIHMKVASSCKERIARNQDPDSGSLFGLNPERTKDWQRVSFECLGVQWHNTLFTLTQEELDAFPECYNEHFFAPSFLESPSLAAQREKFRTAWLAVHEKNRTYLREFFVEEADKVPYEERRQLLSSLFYSHLANLSPQLFFSEPQKEDAMEGFLERASMGQSLCPILEVDEDTY